MHRPLVGMIAASALILTLTACSSPAESSPGQELSPLGEYMSSAYGGDLSPQEQEKQMIEQSEKTEELVAECMTEEGFEYTPQPQSTGYMSTSDDYKPDSRDWVAQYGYGAVNYPGRDEAMDPDEEWVDVNADYVESLSEGEMAAYYEALHGPQPTEEEMSDPNFEWEYDRENAGCYGSAQQEMQGNQGEDPYAADEHKSVVEAMDKLYADMESSPEVMELDAAWSECMADGGYPGFTKQFDAQNSIYEEQNKYYESLGEGEGIEDDPALEEIGEKEIELALVDLDCREKIDYRKKYAEVTYALEEQFIEDHKAELEAFRAASEQYYGQNG